MSKVVSVTRLTFDLIVIFNLFPPLFVIMTNIISSFSQVLVLLNITKFLRKQALVLTYFFKLIAYFL